MSYASDIPDPNLQESQLRKYAKYEYARLTENIQVLMFFAQIYRLIIRVLAVPGWILLRHRFGERFLTFPMVVSSLFWMMMATFLSDSRIGKELTTVFLLLCVGHRLHIWWRNRRGDIWHSRDEGTSYLTKWAPKYEAVIESYVEPLLMVGLGFIELSVAHTTRPEHLHGNQLFWGNGFAAYLIFVGGAMMIQVSRSKKELRNMYLDARDSRLNNEVTAKIQERDAERMEVQSRDTSFSVA